MSNPDIRPIIQEGLQAFDQGGWESSLEIFQRASGIRPDHPVPYFFASLAYLALNEKEKAADSVGIGLQKNHHNGLGWNILAVLALKGEKYKEAFRLLRAYGVMEHPRVQSFLLFEIEKKLAKLEENPLSKEETSHRTESSPGFRKGWKWLLFRLSYFSGKDALEKKKWFEAETGFKRALDIFPSHPEATIGLAQALWFGGKREGARKILQTFLEKDSAFSYAHFLLGVFCMEENDLHNAIESFQQAVLPDPKNAETWYQLGKIYARLENISEGVPALRKITQVDPFILQLRLFQLKEKLRAARKSIP